MVNMETWKPKVELQNGDRPFPKPKYLYLRHELRHFLSKFGMEIDFRLLKQVSLIEIARNRVEKLQI